jgi:hypothetical protein
MATVNPKPPSPGKAAFRGIDEQMPEDFRDPEVLAVSKPVPSQQEQRAQHRKV